MKILVTGGAGFIGSAVVRHIIENTSDSVVNVDCLTYAGNLESLAVVDTSERYAFEQVNICDRAELDRVFAEHKPHAVMHLAAESHVDRSITGPAAFIELILLEHTRYSKQPESIGVLWIRMLKKRSASTISQQMKYTVTFLIQMRLSAVPSFQCSWKLHRMRRQVLTPRLKHQAIT